ncbi:glycerophosphodiester phosphodiesterase family protein [Qingshengfaniella alkalisoli]|uniref:Glycerophosphodiester phosphodiesterase n=1 Tax=Qingshengfaniella alkalisoli TaxID=2599296 RepID=A0A5B8IYL3_9RHOB|nr:glycerophosphodiester phosphodiesterase family protein [Qingshengfaniella alkalisoli]QDY70673.1 glycerophosphodiester phosphodiesterase [Qingshengfaniella alkalisoli]
MTRIASHRGGTLEFGDSTPSGFKATAGMALEEVEFDLHPTSDGEIFVHHDPTLDRTTDQTGAISDHPARKVRSAVIDYSAGQSPLTLTELCAIYHDSPVDFRCEIKPGADGNPYTDFVPRVVQTLAENELLDRTVFSSFLIDTLDELGSASERPRLWLVSPAVLTQLGLKAVIDVAIAHSIPEIGVHIDRANAQMTTEVTDAGLEFGCWAAHDGTQIDKALALGIKVFTTDRPTLAIARRRSLASEAAA